MTTPPFEFVVPILWTRIDLTVPDVSREVQTAIRPIIRSLPLTQQPAIRDLLVPDLVTSMSQLADNGTLCAVVAVSPYDRSPLRPVMTFRSIDPSVFAPLSPAIDLRALLGSIAEADDTADIVEVGDVLAVRSESLHDRTAALRDRFAALFGETSTSQLPMTKADELGPIGEGQAASAATTERARRVHYVLGHETDPERWLISDFTVDHPAIPEGEDLAGALVAQFDALMATFRWQS